MKVAAILGMLIFGALTILFLKLGMNTYQEETVGETPWSPSWVGFGVTLCFAILTLFCFIYAIGMWDSFIAWLQQGTPQPVVVKQF